MTNFRRYVLLLSFYNTLILNLIHNIVKLLVICLHCTLLNYLQQSLSKRTDIQCMVVVLHTFFLLWQMGKQTMGFPVHALDRRADNKLYKLQTPQSPVVRPVMYDHYEMDTYPLGTNAIVAVMSYTVSTTVLYWSCSTCIWSYCIFRMYLYTVNQQNLNMLVRRHFSAPQDAKLLFLDL